MVVNTILALLRSLFSRGRCHLLVSFLVAGAVRVVGDAAFIYSLIDDIVMAVILCRMEVVTAVFIIYFLQSLLYLLSFLRRRLFAPRQRQGKQGEDG